MNVDAAQTSLRGLVQDFFNTTWSRFVDMVFLLLVSVWVWCAGAPAVLAESVVPRPVDWYRGPVESIGWQIPGWLESLAAWRSPAGLWWPQVAVLGAAIACALSASTAAALGYRLSALLLLVASAQWFGVESTILGFLCASTSLAALALIRSWIDDRIGERDGAQYAYFPGIVARNFANGPFLVLLLPIIAPFGAFAAAVRSFAFDNRLLDTPSEYHSMLAAIDSCSSADGTAAQMSERRYALLQATTQLAARAEGGTRSRIARAINVRH